MSFGPAQCRAARALLDWSQDKLASVSGVSTKTIADFERGSRTPYGRTLAEIERALAEVGIEILNHGQPGVRLGPPKPRLKNNHRNLPGQVDDPDEADRVP